MTFWLVAAAITIAVGSVLGAAIWRARGGPIEDEGAEILVYRDQLAELKRDLELGLISPDEAQAAETEIHRHMIQAARKEESGGQYDSAGQPSHLIVGFALILSAPLLAVALYLNLGAPGTSDYPFADRGATSVPGAESHGMGDVARMIDQLSTRLQANPGDADGWLLLARSLSMAQRYEEAANAYRHLFDLVGESPGYDGDYAEVIIRAADDVVTPEAEELFAKVNERDPTDPRARYYLALAKAQGGNGQEAIEGWMSLEVDSPPGAPWLPAVRQRIQQTAQQFDINLATLEKPAPSAPIAAASPTRPQAATPGPTTEDIAAAGSMSANEQDAMIRTMVGRLAERLEQDPGDVDGWIRLARSYAVLGELDNAAEALRRGAQVGGTQEQQSQIVSLAAELGVSLDNAPVSQSQSTAPAAPGSGTVATVPPLTSDDQPMVRSMVANLESRLAENPNDVDGWQRLGRSYMVLRQPDKARSAYARAVALAPKDIPLLQDYADAMLSSSEEIEPLLPESIAAMRELSEKDITNPHAMWYLGLAAAQAGNYEEARRHWNRLLSRLIEGTSTYQAVKSRLEAL